MDSEKLFDYLYWRTMAENNLIFRNWPHSRKLKILNPYEKAIWTDYNNTLESLYDSFLPILFWVSNFSWHYKPKWIKLILSARSLIGQNLISRLLIGRERYLAIINLRTCLSSPITNIFPLIIVYENHSTITKFWPATSYIIQCDFIISSNMFF